MKKNDILKNFGIYIIIFLFIGIDFIISVEPGKSILVYITFFIIAFFTLLLFIVDKGFITIDKMIYIYIFIFSYYAPFHQYLNGTIIHKFSEFSDNDYLFSNILIILFLFTYLFCKKILFNKLNYQFLREEKIILTNKKMELLKLISIVLLVVLFFQGELFSISSDSDNTEGMNTIILKFERFIPISILVIYFYISKNNGFYDVLPQNRKKYLTVISIVCIIIFFPINGTISRYLLFGTYIMVAAILFDRSKWKSIILLTAVLGFYFVFPAFNFFKTHSLSEISQFTLGGFDVNYIDYDAYELGMATVRYVKENGILYGKNLLTALFCFIPRSILPIKLQSSPVIIGNYFNLSFTNLSCPFYAEAYLAGGIIGVILSTIVFAFFMRIVEIGKENNNYIFYGLYYISIAIIFAFMRGSILPMTSFWMILSIAYLIVCIFIKKEKKNRNEC